MAVTHNAPLDRPAVVIVNFNSGPHLERCLQSIADHAPGSAVVVVDNASADDSLQAASRAGRGVAVLRNTMNIGFARAMNQGLAGVASQFVLLLNPDCLLTPGALAALEAELAAHTECGVVGPQILDEDGTIQGSVRGDPDLLTGLFGRTSLLTRLFPRSAPARRNVRVAAGRPADGASHAADWVSGACMLARRAALVDIRGFDERYFLYWEDADLCRRLRARGYTTRYMSRARVVHTVGQSSRTAPAVAIRAFHRSAYTYYTTHVARSGFARCFARAVLGARCRWKLLVSRVRAAMP